MFKFTFKKISFCYVIVNSLKCNFQVPVNIIFPSVDTSVLMVPSYWAELGAVLHAYISPQLVFCSSVFQ